MAMGVQVIPHDAPAIGPADQHRPLQTKGVDHPLYLVGPDLPGLVEGVALRLRAHAVAADVVGHQAEFPGEFRVAGLPVPGQRRLHVAVDEEDRLALRVAVLVGGDLHPVRRAHRVPPMGQRGLRRGRLGRGRLGLGRTQPRRRHRSAEAGPDPRGKDGTAVLHDGVPLLSPGGEGSHGRCRPGKPSGSRCKRRPGLPPWPQQPPGEDRQ